MMAADNLQPGCNLATLFEGLAEHIPSAELQVSGLTMDSRQVVAGDLFLACAGSREHGAAYVDEAIKRGAIAIAMEQVEGSQEDVLTHWQQSDIPVIAVPGLRQRSGEVAARFFQFPSRELLAVGVTGTNGKTSVSQFLAKCLGQSAPCGVIGTLGNGLYTPGVMENSEQLESTGHTTPDAVSLQARCADFVADGAKYVVLEVSSHALDQGRVNGVAFDVAVFTNLSHEHLDYHGDMESYARAKRRLFKQAGLKQAVINADDEVGRQWLAELPSATSYGLNKYDGKTPDIYASKLELSVMGLRMEVTTPAGEGVLNSPLLGRFNASNLLAALGALLAANISLQDALARLGQIGAVPGRMEHFGGEGGQTMVVVDYAHTSDALEQVLKALREHCQGDLWCIFGCGGDRDTAKRPLMGRVAEQLADYVVITNDNPRSEEPFSIIEGIQAGMHEPDYCYVIPDRAEAIRHTLHVAKTADVVLVAGKGHETAQLIGDKIIPFSDREQVAALLAELAKEVAHG